MSHTLTSANRDFFRRVALAAFSNPFSDERIEEDLSIAGLTEDRPDRVAHVAEAVVQRVRALERSGGADIRLYDGEDRQLLLVAFLFEAFHHFLEDFDRLIAEQARQGDEPVRAPFVRNLWDLLARRGYSSEGIRHFLAVFYQLRRAFYFIARGLPGRAPCMQDLRRRLWNNVFTSDIRWYERYLWDRMEDFSTLLLGETGAGKGAAAAAIGRSGYIPYDEKRSAFTESFTRTFVASNLSQFPSALLESELFGHRKGAFTGAVEHHEGLLARCRPCGAIFLDEIGEVPATVQVKLLQVLQERTFTPVGSHDQLRFRGRVIAATNRSLDELRGGGGFREDFFFRLCSDVITVPSLRQRLAEDPSELRLLLESLLPRLVGEEGAELISTVEEALRVSPGPDHPWPGNVRELEQAVRQILLHQRYEPSPATRLAAAAPARVAAWARGEVNAQELLKEYCALLYEQSGTYEAVARRAGLDRRTVKKYLSS